MPRVCVLLRCVTHLRCTALRRCRDVTRWYAALPTRAPPFTQRLAFYRFTHGTARIPPPFSDCSPPAAARVLPHFACSHSCLRTSHLHYALTLPRSSLRNYHTATAFLSFDLPPPPRFTHAFTATALHHATFLHTVRLHRTPHTTLRRCRYTGTRCRRYARGLHTRVYVYYDILLLRFPRLLDVCRAPRTHLTHTHLTVVHYVPTLPRTHTATHCVTNRTAPTCFWLLR